MEFIKNLISQLDSATSDPIVKLLVISVTLLLVIIIFTLIINAIKKFFRVLFAASRHKKKKKIQSAVKVEDKTKKPKPIEKEKEEELTTDTCFQTARAILSELKESFTQLAGLDLIANFPKPLIAKSDNPLYTAETINKLSHTIDNEATAEAISKKIGDMNISQLEALLQNAENNASTVSITTEANKAKFLKLVEERQGLLSTNATAIESYNQELEKAKEAIEGAAKIKETAILSIAGSEKSIDELISTVNKLTEDLKVAKEQLVTKSAEAQINVDKAKELIANASNLSTQTQTTLSARKLLVENNSAELDENATKLSVLKDTIIAENKELLINQITIQVVTGEINRLRDEEARRIAEQKAREEAEAKARALEEAKRLEEEQRKREEELRLEEERRREEARLLEEKRREAEKLEQLRIQEERERKALEEQRKHEERQRELELLKQELAEAKKPGTSESSEDSDDSGDENSVDAFLTKLTAEEEADQAKALMEAQRAKRRKAAEQKAKGEAPPVPQPEPIAAVVDDAPTPETTVSAEEVLNDSFEVSKSTEAPNEKPVIKQTPPPDEDPMAKIKAEWERERNVEEALKAGNVEEALNLVNKKAT